MACDLNSSSEWSVRTITGQAPSSIQPSVYFCAGATPDHAIDWQFKYSMEGDANLVALNAHASHIESDREGMVKIAAGHGNYAPLNNTQCSVKFLPELFGVYVNVTGATITVTGLRPADDTDPTAQTNATFESWNCNALGDPSFSDTFMNGCGKYTARGQPGLGNIATRALRQLVDLSTLGNSFHISNLGEMFLSNIQNQLQWNRTNSFDDVNATDYNSTTLDQTNDHATLRFSIEMALKYLLDDSLFAFASAQIAMQKSTRSTPVTMTVRGVRFGTSGYIYGLFVSIPSSCSFFLRS